MTTLPNRRVRTPAVLQMEAVECGAAALAMVLGHYGRHVPLDELRTECGVSRDGSRASDLLQAARRHGLVARGGRGEIPALGAISLPAILFWNFNHFVVLEGFGRQGRDFYLNDPASGHRKVSAEEFTGSFTGVLLTFSPGPDFSPRKRAGSPGAILRKQLAAAPGTWAFAGLCALLLVVPVLAVPALIQVFVDSYYIGGEEHWLNPLLAGLVLAAGLQMALTALQRTALQRWRLGRAARESGELFSRLLRLPMAWFQGRGAGEIAGRLSLPEENAALVGNHLAPVLLSAPLMAGLVLMMLAYDRVLTGPAVLAAALGLAFSVIRSRSRQESANNLAHAQGMLEGAALNGIAQIEHLKCSGQAGFLHRIGQLGNKVRGEWQRQEAMRQIWALPAEALFALALAGLLIFGAWRIVSGDLTSGALVAIVILWLQLHFYMQGWLKGRAHLERWMAGCARLADLPEDAGKRPALDEAANVFQGLEARDLVFGYASRSEPVLKGASLSILPGQHVALVGASGSGKTTLLRLLGGLYQPWSGDVKLNGSMATPEALARCAAVAEQDLTLFTGTVEENLLLGNPGVGDLAEAVRSAGLEAVLAARPGGWHGPVVANGANFSGGQRQRLEIARLLARHSGLLLLDEAMSALDEESASALLRELRGRGCAMLDITHRLESLRAADEILVLDRGVIVERGSFAELARPGTVFQHLTGA